MSAAFPSSDDPHGDYLNPPMPVCAYYADDVDYGWPIMCEEACDREAECGCTCCVADRTSHFCADCCPCRNKDRQANQLACDATDCGEDPDANPVAA